MKIDLYVTTYNDEDFLPFYLDYYLKIADRITFIDNGSTDNTLKLIEQSSVKGGPVIRIYNTGMTWWDWDKGLVIRNTIWRDSDYDYVFFTDLDEIIYHPDLKGYLQKTDCDIYQLEGYQMVSYSFPSPKTDILFIRNGVRFHLMDKFSIFKPTADINCINAHSIFPTTSKVCSGAIKMLHYKFIGTKALVKRVKNIKERVPANSYVRGIRGNILKIFPGFVKTESEFKKEISDLMRKSKLVI